MVGDRVPIQISRAEYVRLMGTRGVSAEESNATFNDMDHSGSNLMTVAKLQHYAYTKSIELIADSFKEIDLQDGSRDRARPAPASDLRPARLVRAQASSRARTSASTY